MLDNFEVYRTSITRTGRLLCTAAEQDQLPVLRYLTEILGVGQPSLEILRSNKLGNRNLMSNSEILNSSRKKS